MNRLSELVFCTQDAEMGQMVRNLSFHSGSLNVFLNQRGVSLLLRKKSVYRDTSTHTWQWTLYLADLNHERELQ